MNKKFFAALTSAAMLLSSTGVVAFAADFEDADVITENGGLDEANPNLPDTSDDVKLKDTFGAEVLKALRDDPTSGIGTKNTVKKKVLAEVKNLTVDKASDLKGMEYLTGLETLTLTNGTYTTLDLSAQTNLKTLVANGDEALTSVKLPATATLTNLEMTGNTALTTIDLSGNGMLNKVNVSQNNLGSLDVTGLPYLTELKVAGQPLRTDTNSLNTLDLSKNYQLTYVNAAYNGLYEIKLPASVVTVLLNDNKMGSLDASSLKNLEILDVTNNGMESLKVASTVTILRASKNHLATLDLKDFNGTADLSNQTLYYNVGDKAVSLKGYDEAFDKKGLAKDTTTNKAIVSGGSIDADGVFTFNDKKGDPAYTWNTNATAATAKNMEVKLVAAVRMNRLYNPNSGEHFYTKDAHEKDVLVGLGWQYEGIGWNAPESGAPVYRLYNPNAGDHHYTKSANEKDTLVNVGWQYEGIGWYSATEAPYVNLQVYREYNPNAKAAGAHNYTVSEVENDALVSLGWIDEGTAWWALK